MAAALALVAVPLLGAAGGEVSRYRTPLAGGAFLGVSSSQALAPGQAALGASLGFASNPVTWRYEDDSYDPVIGHRLSLELMASLGVLPYVDVGIGAPLSLAQRGRDSLELGNPGGAGYGDVRLVPRLTLLPERIFGTGVGLISEITVPTGDEQRFLGDRSVSWRPRAIATTTLWGMRLLGSVGYVLRRNAEIRNLTLGDEITFHVAVAQPLNLLGTAVTALYELAGGTAAAAPLRGDGRTALEARAGLRARLLPTVEITGAVGAGLTQGIGSPMARLLLGMAYVAPVGDRDADQVPDPLDACPDDPEDYDHYADLDGCPDDEAEHVEAGDGSEPSTAPTPSAPNPIEQSGRGARQRNEADSPTAAPRARKGPEAKTAPKPDDGARQRRSPVGDGPDGDDEPLPQAREPTQTSDDNLDLDTAPAPGGGREHQPDGA